MPPLPLFADRSVTAAQNRRRLRIARHSFRAGTRPMIPAVTVRPVTAADLAAIAALHGRAFGPGRFVRAAHRVREGQPDFSALCLVAELAGVVVAAIRMTPITIGGRAGAVMLGPLAVEPAFAGQGIGRHLVAEALARARALGCQLVVLVGDQSYYGRFGFSPVPAGAIGLPGPFDGARLLAAELIEGSAGSFRGMVVAAAGATDAGADQQHREAAA